MESFEHTSKSAGAKRGFKITVGVDSWDSLKNLSNVLPQEHRKSFNLKYGRILDLLSIEVKAPALSALAQYWNSDLRCFELPNVDIAPTIEEYAYMLRIPVKEHDTFYFRLDQPLSEVKMIERCGKLMGIHPSQLKIVGHANSRGLTRTFLENHLGNLAQ